MLWVAIFLGILGTSYGQWTTYVSQREVQDLLTVEGKIWAATSGGLFRWDPRDSVFSCYSDFGDVQNPQILSLTMDREGTFWLGTAQDGLIRWSPDEGVLGFYPVFAEDRIQALWACGDSILVGTARNGVCLFSAAEGEVLECYRRLGKFSRGAEVNSLAVFGDTLFVGTEEGIAWASLNAPNLYDPASWKTVSVSEEGYAIGPVNAIANRGDVVFIGSKWGVFRRGRRGWKLELRGVSTYDLAARGDTLAVAAKDGIYLKVGNRRWVLREVQGWIPHSLAFAREGLWVYLSTGHAMVKDYVLYLLNRGLKVPLTLGPPGGQFTDLAIDHNGVLWAATSIRDLSPGGLYRFDGEHWSRYAWWDTYRDAVTCIAVDKDGYIWAGTWGKGIFRIRDDGTPDVWADSIVWITSKNSPLSPTVDTSMVVIGDIAVDHMGRIWVANYMAHGSPIPTNTPIVVFDGFPPKNPIVFTDRDGVPDGEGMVLLPLEGKMWLGTCRMGLALLDYGPSLRDKEDDHWVHISTASFPQLTSNKILDIETTPDGRILVATENGLNVLRGICREGKFDVEDWEVYDISDGLPSNLVYAVCPTPDGIWLGTEGGLVHLKDGSAVTYTRRNSPLPDNSVYALAFDNRTGYLWIGTGHGLSRLRISLTSDTSAPAVEAFPNPFSPKEGPITFRNLPEGSSLLIFSPSGELIRSLSPKGGTEVKWKGDNDAGFLVGSGIYLYVVRDPQGSIQVGKVALIRR